MFSSARPRAVAHLPDREQLGEPAAVRGVSGASTAKKGCASAQAISLLVQVGGAGLDIAGVRLQPLVVVRE